MTPDEIATIERVLNIEHSQNPDWPMITIGRTHLRKLLSAARREERLRAFVQAIASGNVSSWCKEAGAIEEWDCFDCGDYESVGEFYTEVAKFVLGGEASDGPHN